MLYAVKTYMQHSCFQKHFTVIIYSPKKASVALIAVGTSNIELKERLVPHHIKTAGCHRHEPNRLSLLSSTYKRQIRQLESGLRLLMWQISNGWGGETLPIAAHPYITGPELSLLCGIFNVTFHFEALGKGRFLIFLSSKHVLFVIRGVKNMFWEGRKSTCLLFGPHSSISHAVRRRTTLCSYLREAVSLHLLGFDCWIQDCWRGYGS